MSRTLLLSLSLGATLVFGWPAGAHSQASEAAPASEGQPEADHPLSKLAWKVGPTKVDVGANAELSVPEGFVYLHEADTARFMEFIQNPPTPGEVMFGPEDLSWFAILRFDDTGYIEDNEEVDADAVLETVRNDTESSNAEWRKHGWGELHVTGWRFKPRYDKETNRLEWAIDAQGSEGIVTNFNTRLLGRRGVTAATLVDAPENLEKTLPVFKSVLSGYAFKEGERYAEFTEGDKVAEYGLAGLILGGAAAVAAKSGFLKAAWKFIAVGVVAAFAGLKSLFRKKQNA